jgi:hypothetical protein
MEKIPLLISRLARLCRRGEDFDTLVKAYGLTKEEQDLLRMVLYTGSDMKRNK